MNIKYHILFLGMFAVNTLLLSETLYTSASTLSSPSGKATSTNNSDETRVHNLELWLPI